MNHMQLLNIRKGQAYQFSPLKMRQRGPGAQQYRFPFLTARVMTIQGLGGSTRPVTGGQYNKGTEQLEI
jgi:hypothetical protein